MIFVNLFKNIIAANELNTAEINNGYLTAASIVKKLMLTSTQTNMIAGRMIFNTITLYLRSLYPWVAKAEMAIIVANGNETALMINTVFSRSEPLKSSNASQSASAI